MVTDNCDVFDCYWVIKNIIWKNIVAYIFVDKKLHFNAYHNNFQKILYPTRHLNYSPYLYYDALLNKQLYEISELKDNCIIFQTKIINHMMLLDILVAHNMISDLIYPFKMYMFNVMLLI